jgi:6-phosphogluconolactonase/glucosamine-6-phosphate isomerase/deaminase
MMASGSKKSEVVKLALEGSVSTSVPGSAIQHHSNGIVMLDKEAARLLGK